MDRSKLHLRQAVRDVEIEAVFALMDVDFPPFARIPLFMLRRAIKGGVVRAFFLTDGRALYGYALVQRTPELPMLHIRYMAVRPRHRDRGLGGALLRLLGELAPGGILLDVENPSAAKNPGERALRVKRVNFYERNGFGLLPGFGFDNVGFKMRVMANVPLPEGMDWLGFYRRLYGQVHGRALWPLLIRPDGDQKRD